MIWHPVTPICQACGVHCEPTCISFRADGMVAVEGKCSKCHLYMYIEFTADEVIRNCRNMDNPNLPDFDLRNFQARGKPN